MNGMVGVVAQNFVIKVSNRGRDLVIFWLKTGPLIMPLVGHRLVKQRRR